MRASVLVRVFWRAQGVVTSRVVVRKTKTPPVFSPGSRYKFMTWRWFCAGCFSVQLLPNLSTSRDFDLSARQSEFQKAPVVHMDIPSYIAGFPLSGWLFA